jgi:hypothetical protein
MRCLHHITSHITHLVASQFTFTQTTGFSYHKAKAYKYNHPQVSINKPTFGRLFSASRNEIETLGRAVKGLKCTAVIECAHTTPMKSQMKSSFPPTITSRVIQNLELVLQQSWIERQQGNLSLWAFPLSPLANGYCGWGLSNRRSQDKLMTSPQKRKVQVLLITAAAPSKA